MKTGLLDFLSNTDDASALIAWLDSSTFDELVEVDIANDTFRMVYHVGGKYAALAPEGSYDELYRFSSNTLVHPEDRSIYATLMDPSTMRERLEDHANNGLMSAQFRCKMQDDSWRWIEQFVIGGSRFEELDGIARYYVFDIQNQVERKTKGGLSILRPSDFYRDERSGLLWEKAFFSEAKKRVEETDVSGWCLIVIDLDHFSLFNDWYGRATGDKLLADIGRELVEAERASGGLAGYLGQDDFCFFAPYEPDRIENLFNKLNSKITDLVPAIGFKPIFGMCIVDEQLPFMDLYDRAKMALEHARGDFKIDICLFEPEMHDRTDREYHTLIDFQRGIRNNEFIAYLQPQCRISSGKIVGVEALARWRREDGTIIPPIEFIPTLEKYGFITDLDCYMWELVCKQMRNWIDTGHEAVPVSVNVSQADFYAIDVAKHFKQLVEKYDIPPSLLKVEITESTFAENTSEIVEVTNELRRLGFMVLMDDFGSGYSSLNMLSNLNVDVIKLDAAFMRLDDADRHRSIRIVESVIHMAKTMGLPIVTEGVETADQVEFLESLGVRYIQGFYYYRPMSTEDFEQLIGDGVEIDDRGFVVKHNEQLKAREFLDRNVYSDAMLNNILGPVAYYTWNGDDINIVRFNEQFYQAVGVPNFHDRLDGIQKYTPEADVPKLYALFERALADELNGASDVIGFFKPDGTPTKFFMRLYYLGESGEGKRFYGSVWDVTETVELHAELKMLSECLSSSIVIMRRYGGSWHHRVIIHGLEGVSGISQNDFQRGLDDKSVLARITPESMAALREAAHTSIQNQEGFTADVDILNGQGEIVHLALEADRIHDTIGEGSYLVKLTEKGC